MPEPTFSDKYRGTEFAPPDAEPGAPGTASAPGGPRRRRTAIVVIALVVAIGAGAGSTALALTQKRPEAAPAAGPGATPAGGAQASAGTAPSAGPSGAAQSAPSGAPPGAPPPLASESPDQRARRIIAAFGARMLVPGIAYRISGTGSASSNVGTYKWSAAWTVVGENSSARLVARSTLPLQKGKETLDTVVVGMDMWLRVPGRAWKKTRTTGAFRMAPFLDITQAREFVYKGSAACKGGGCHRLVSTSDYHPSLTKWSGLVVNAMLITDRSMEIIVRNDGTPVSARFTYALEGSGFRVHGSASFRFSMVGSKKLVVARPK